MPRTIEVDGQQVTVYLAEEHQAALVTAQEQARQGLVPAAERDSAAAAARREVEGQLAAVRVELVTAQAGSARAQELETQRAALEVRATAAERTLQGVEVLAVEGLTPTQARVLLGSSLFSEVDLASDDARNAAIAQVKSTFPGLFQAPPAPGGTGGGGEGGQRGAEFGGSGGGGGGRKAEPAVADIEKMSQAEFEQWRAGRAGA